MIGVLTVNDGKFQFLQWDSDLAFGDPNSGFTGGRIYDSLLLACAAKCKAQAVYTGNLKHYQSLAPDLAPRMQTP